MSSIGSHFDELPLEVRLWNGSRLGALESAIGTILIKSERALRHVLRNPSLGLAQGYAQDEIQIEGDLTVVLRNLLRSKLGRKQPSMWSRLRRVLSPNSVRRTRRNAIAHYDYGNDFYSPWLDPTMTYSCAVFPSEQASLSEAQQTKCDLIFSKLALKPGDRLLDIGCGWGYLVMRAAEECGARSYGVTQSPGQVSYAAEEIERHGLTRSCQVELRDYRRVEGTFDKIASVGMLEHVGRRYLHSFFESVSKALEPNGRCLIQVITQRQPEASTDFTESIFPGGYFPAPPEVISHAVGAGLFWRHGDDLSEHYALTLKHWLSNFRRARQRVEAATDPQFVRWWEIYLAVSEAAFLEGRLQLFQFLFTKGPVGLPLTRQFASF